MDCKEMLGYYVCLYRLSACLLACVFCWCVSEAPQVVDQPRIDTIKTGHHGMREVRRERERKSRAI